MGRQFGCALGILAMAACASAPPRPAIPPPPPEAPSPAPKDSIVAFYNGEPVLRREVAEKVLELNLRGAIGNYVRWRVVQEQMKMLGARNTPEELRRRADTVVRLTRERLGADAFKAQLSREGLTETAYRDYVARSTSLDYTFSVEKLVRFDAIVAGSITLDRVWFADQKEADAFAIHCRKGGFEAALKALATRTPAARYGHRAGEILAPGRPSPSPAVDPWILEKVRAAKPGEVVGVERSSGNLFFVLKLVARKEPRTVAYGEVREEILTSILEAPPAEQDCEHWVQAAVGRVRVEMAESPNRGS